MSLYQTISTRFSIVAKLFLLTLILISRAQAESGGVDLSFNAKPSKAATFGVGSVFEPDGKIIVFGEFLSINGGAKNQIARLNTDGSLDDSFNCVVCDFNFSVSSVVLQPDGKIIVAGATAGSFQQAVVIRLNPDGSRDFSFAVPVIPIRWQISSASVRAVQPDGKILIVITDNEIDPYPTYLSKQRQDSLLRLNSDGSMDETFSRIYFRGGYYGYQAVGRVLLQPDGKILVGLNDATEGGAGYIYRYNSDGAPDTSFRPPSLIGQFYSRIYDIALQSDGSIIITGDFGSLTGVPLVPSPGIARLLPDGTIDTSFVSEVAYPGSVEVLSNGQILVSKSNKLYRLNTNGSIDNTFNAPGNLPSIYNLILDSANRVLLFGEFSIKGKSVFRYARLNADGSLNFAFNVGIEVAGSVMVLAVQADGKIIVSGDFSRMNDAPRKNIARLNADGSLDSTFDPGNGFDGAVTKIIIQPDGKILVNGSFRNYNGTPRAGIARLNPDGSLDAFISPVAAIIALQADGKIVIGGSFTSVNGVVRNIARLNSDGSLDANFNPVTQNFSIDSLFVQADGKILVGGQFSNNIRLIRLNSDGTLDDSFNSDIFPTVTQIEALPDGKYLVVANTVARLNANGTRDASFQPQTYNGMPQSPFYNTGVNAILAQPDGSVIVAGSFTAVNGVPRLGLARLKPNGTLDTSFLPNGANKQVRAIIKQADEKILVGGDFTNIANINRVGVARLSIIPFRIITPFDFDDDGKADLSVFRPASGVWYWLKSSSNESSGQQFGSSSDVIAPADFDGDGKTDLAVFRDGIWYIQQSSQGFTGVAFGQAGDIPVPADYDGDGKADIAVWRPSDGTWYRLNSSNGQSVSVQFGLPGDKPTIGDFDGNGTSDIAVFRPSNGTWYRLNSSNQLVGQQFGASGDIIVPADYDGDGKTDIAVYRPSNGVWYLQRSALGFAAVQFGDANDKPVPADYDGDGRTDLAVFRPSEGIWYLQRSTEGFAAQRFGLSTDIPIPNAYVR